MAVALLIDHLWLVGVCGDGGKEREQIGAIRLVLILILNLHFRLNVGFLLGKI